MRKLANRYPHLSANLPSHYLLESLGANPMLNAQAVPPPPPPPQPAPAPTPAPAGPPPFQHPEGSYIGGIADDMASGEGTLVTHSGSTYTGSFQYNMRHGEGVESFLDGRAVSGCWTENTLQLGTQKLGQTVYSGSLQSCLPHGRGTMETNNSAQVTYTDCEFAAGKLVQGGMTCSTGAYFGTYAELGPWTAGGLPFGPAEGKLTTNNGFVPWTEMEGTFSVAQGRFNGKVTYSNGDEYTGSALIQYNPSTLFHVTRHGQGAQTSLTMLLQGNFVQDDFVEGKCTYPNNDVYDGQMVRGKKHGLGKLMLHQGFCEHNGRWKDDEKYDEMSGGCCVVQ